MTNSKRYYQRKLLGLCTYCGKPLPPRWGYVQCHECRIKTYEKKFEAPKPETHKAEMSKSLDEMSILSKETHMSYGKLQALEITRRLRNEQS